MRCSLIHLPLILTVTLVCESAVNADESFARNTGQTEAALKHSFSLKTLEGELVSVGFSPDSNAYSKPSEFKNPKVTVVCFLGTECPLVMLYSLRLSQMANEFRDRQVRFVGINSNRQDTEEDIRHYLEQHQLTFPLLRDPANKVADAYGATRTPEVFLLDSKLQLVYQGRIDDQYEPGINRTAATRDDLRIAIEETLANKSVSVASTNAVGCMIGKIRSSAVSADAVATEDRVTYFSQAVRVLEKHCIECHRAGEIGPFALDNYDDAVGWAETCLEVINNGRMPPWGADPAVGHFANARDMPESDKQVLRNWVAQGMPMGDATAMPERPSYVDGWQLGRKPDLILQMRNRPYEVAAEGTIEYQYFVIDPGFDEDRWISGAQIIPGNHSVVHHAIVFVRPPDGSEFRGIGLLTGYVPGQRLVPMPRGYARKIPAGSKLVFQMHYTANGTPQQDNSQIGLVFADPQHVTHQVVSLIGIDQEFEIPPHVENHEVRGRVRRIPKGGRLLALAPHMHVRGKSFSMTAERDGRQEPLLNVPNYDFNWQHNYVLAQPLELDEYDNIHFTATFDNSKNNPFNPDPTQWVNWGDQTWEEMAVVFLEVAEPIERTPGSAESVVTIDTAMSPDREARIKEFVDDFFRQLDQNGDGVVLRDEAPLALKNRLLRFDEDGDNRVTREDVMRIAEQRIK